jgi:hypothetical protein
MLRRTNLTFFEMKDALITHSSAVKLTCIARAWSDRVGSRNAWSISTVCSKSLWFGDQSVIVVIALYCFQNFRATFFDGFLTCSAIFLRDQRFPQIRLNWTTSFRSSKSINPWIWNYICGRSTRRWMAVRKNQVSQIICKDVKLRQTFCGRIA